MESPGHTLLVSEPKPSASIHLCYLVDVPSDEDEGGRISEDDEGSGGVERWCGGRETRWALKIKTEDERWLLFSV